MHDWWVLRDRKAMTYWGGGDYFLHDPRYRCNWDINDYVWRKNRELLTNKAELPVIQQRFGDTGEAGDYERGYHTLETEVLWRIKIESVASYTCQTSTDERQSASKQKIEHLLNLLRNYNLWYLSIKYLTCLN